MSTRNYTAVIERCPDTGLLVGYVPGFPGAHSQGETLDELRAIDARIDERVLPHLSVEASVASRRSAGGTAPERVREAIAAAHEQIAAREVE